MLLLLFKHSIMLQAYTNNILDIKNTFYDMHPRSDAKRGIMQTRVLEKMRAEGSKTPFDPETERTAFGER